MRFGVRGLSAGAAGVLAGVEGALLSEPPALFARFDLTDEMLPLDAVRKLSKLRTGRESALRKRGTVHL